MKARDIMTTGSLACVTRGDSLQEAARRMREADVGSLPVVEDSNSMRLVGLITDRDIVVRHVADDNSPSCTVERHMTSDRLHTVSPDDDVDNVMRTMKSQQVRRVPVCEGDRLVGMIAQADIATDTRNDSDTGEVVERISEPSRRS